MTAAAILAPRDTRRPVSNAVTLRRVPAFGGLDVLRATYLTHSFEPHFHETYAIGVITRGTCALQCRGSTHLVHAGNVVAIAAGEVHTGQLVGDDGWSCRMIYPSAGVLAAALGDDDCAPIESVRFRSPVLDNVATYTSFRALHATLTETDCVVEQETSTLFFLRTLLAAHGEERPILEPGRNTRSVGMALDYLHAHCAEPVSLTTLAAVAGLSCFHFIRVFRAHLGLTPHSYLAVLRLERAKALMRSGLPIAQVAVATGFSDQSHLTRFFKRVYGTTPGVYAKASK